MIHNHLSVCTGFQYGPECAEECGCDVVNTDSCDPVDGECTCKAGWTGTNCTDDIDECVNSTICGDELKTCANTNGSFVCNCIMGYIKSTDGSCGGKKFSPVFINFSFESS